MLVNLFSIPSGDQSVYYLGQIFGYVGNILPAENPPLLVGMMFKGLNTLLLTVGAFLVVYVTVVGLLKTAQEGEFLGRQWNGLWVPLRTVMGIVALFPTATGYSAIQVVIMWIILQGVGAADTLWSRVIDFVGVTGSPYSAVNSSSLQSMTTLPQIKKLFSALVCQASAKSTYAPIQTGGSQSIKYYCGIKDNNGQNFCTQSESDMLDPIKPPKGSAGFANSYPMGPEGQCGTLKYCDAKKECTDPDSLTCLSCKEQRSALQAIVPALGSVARKFVELDYRYSKFYETKLDSGGSVTNWLKDYCEENHIDNCCPPFSSPTCSGLFPLDKDTKNNDYSNTSSNTGSSFSPTTAATDLYMKFPLSTYLNGSDFIDAAVGEYNAALVGAVAKHIDKQMSKGVTNNSGFKNPNLLSADQSWDQIATPAKQNGWVMAGAFYYKIANMNKSNQEAVYLPMIAPEPKEITLSTEYRNNYAASTNMVNLMLSDNKSNAGFATSSSASTTSPEIAMAFSMSSQALLESWMNSLRWNTTTNNTNPLIAISNFGYQMMITAQLLFVVLTAGVALAVGLSSINIMVLGTGLTMNPFGEALKAVLGLLGPFFVLLIGGLYSIGALLGIYLPLIPYMIFTMGAIGWLIATVEAMVAGPIIALGILSPGGQHDVLGRAEPALMQIFNLFLRPGLMVIGMMVSMLLSIVAVRFVNAGFLAATASIMTNPGLFEQIMLIIVYTSFIVTVLNKTFSLIYVVPERVLTWIGGPAVQYGEAEALQSTRQALEGGAGGLTSAGKETGGGLHAGQAIKYARQGGEKKADEQSPELKESNKGDSKT